MSEAPFCGPYTAAAPFPPSRGLSTSLASTTSALRMRWSRSVRSTWATSSSPRPPVGTGCPESLRNRAPSATSIPAPPSVDDEPPTASTIFVQPASNAAAMTSPVPCVPALRAVSRVGETSAMPEASASSTIAVLPDCAQVASTGCPIGPATVAVRSSKPAARAAATVPSPPSAIGTDDTVWPAAVSGGVSSAAT